LRPFVLNVENFLQTVRRKSYRLFRLGNRARQTEEFLKYAVEALRFDRHARVVALCEAISSTALLNVGVLRAFE